MRGRRGNLLISVAVALGLCVVVGTGAGFSIVVQNAGCAQTFEDLNEGRPLDADQLEKCRMSLPRQLEIAAAATNFLPTGDKWGESGVTAITFGVLVDHASRPPAVAHNPLPPDITFPEAGGAPTRDLDDIDVTAHTEVPDRCLPCPGPADITLWSCPSEPPFGSLLGSLGVKNVDVRLAGQSYEKGFSAGGKDCAEACVYRVWCTYEGSADVLRSDGGYGNTGTRSGSVAVDYVPRVLADDGHRPAATCAMVRGLDPGDASVYRHNSHAITLQGPLSARSDAMRAAAWRLFAERLAAQVEGEAMACP
ncbi:MAG: hypothetical protein EP330_09605 [Deltaproteobacteria bacterium]|nr:MAG: hypothetical protein EP330_09605 [Deltaproteobacteria bacterium]